jgi:hypothetical protein
MPSSDEPPFRDEYDLAQLRGGVRGKYFGRYHTGLSQDLAAELADEMVPWDRATDEDFQAFLDDSECSE